MEDDGSGWFSPKLLRLIQAYYRQTKSRVRTRGGETESFEVQSGVRQGCPLSPTFFNFAVDWILWNAMAGLTGVQVSTKLALTDLAYADDIILLS